MASLPDQWTQGLAGYTDTTADGMLFTMPSGCTYSFHIGSVDEPVLIAFFAEDIYLDKTRKVVVDVGYLDAEHPVKTPTAAYQWVLELTGPYAQVPGAYEVLRDCADGLRLLG